jgi:hypothetical protein
MEIPAAQEQALYGTWERAAEMWVTPATTREPGPIRDAAARLQGRGPDG